MIKFRTAILKPVTSIYFKKALTNVATYRFECIPRFMWTDEKFVTAAVNREKYIAEYIYDYLPKREERKAFIIPVLKVNPDAINVTHKLRKDRDVIYAYAEGIAKRNFITHLKNGTSAEEYKNTKHKLVDEITEMLSKCADSKKEIENNIMRDRMIKIFEFAEDKRIEKAIEEYKQRKRKEESIKEKNRENISQDAKKLHEEIERE